MISANNKVYFSVLQNKNILCSVCIINSFSVYYKSRVTVTVTLLWLVCRPDPEEKAVFALSVPRVAEKEMHFPHGAAGKARGRGFEPKPQKRLSAALYIQHWRPNPAKQTVESGGRK